ncbi:MAG: YdiU family protein [Pseudobacteriovorax sp.]|nr:YdiU family protein [Pseudobacteriovorax sp.]
MLDNTYARLPSRFYHKSNPSQCPDPKLVLFNHRLAEDVQLEFPNNASIVDWLSGNKLIPGSEPIALAYAGSQFGYFVPQLGDGRAHLLGEINGLDLQLKGSGVTMWSRGADGKCPLGPAIREFIVSEAMNALGVPTTRALSIIASGEIVHREDGDEPGAVLARIADSHIRVGTFQYFHHKEDVEALEILCDYSIKRHYPEINPKGSNRYIEFLRAFAERQGNLIAKWFAQGFIHGVMNTDNCSIAGITIDYGPCAFMDNYQFNKVFSSIDTQGRYAYGNQMTIVKWNISQLAECLIPLISDQHDRSTKLITETLLPVFNGFKGKITQAFASKLGFDSSNREVEILIGDFLKYLELHSLDFTKSFCLLPNLYHDREPFFPHDAGLKSFFTRWKALTPNINTLAASNPQLIPRNHQVQKAIDFAYQNDFQYLHTLWEAIKDPFSIAPEHQHLAAPPKEGERVYQTFCGT